MLYIHTINVAHAQHHSSWNQISVFWFLSSSGILPNVSVSVRHTVGEKNRGTCPRGMKEVNIGIPIKLFGGYRLILLSIYWSWLWSHVTIMHRAKTMMPVWMIWYNHSVIISDSVIWKRLLTNQTNLWRLQTRLKPLTQPTWQQSSAPFLLPGWTSCRHRRLFPFPVC